MDYSDILPIPEQLIRNFEPKSTWLSHDSELHGVDHMARVFILQELICDKLEEQGIAVNREVVRWAAMAHDVGRLDDGIDLEHGRVPRSGFKRICAIRCHRKCLIWLHILFTGMYHLIQKHQR
jgi:hypothetical protein